jgi:hypothetical protein
MNWASSPDPLIQPATMWLFGRRKVAACVFAGAAVAKFESSPDSSQEMPGQAYHKSRLLHRTTCLLDGTLHHTRQIGPVRGGKEFALLNFHRG